jgi:hypothetical protein
MDEWREDAQRLIRKARKRRLKILVWGPGDPGTDSPETKRRLYEKRLKIQETLKAVFPRATVYKSEDPEARKLVEGVTDELVQEEAQALTAHIIMVLAISRGTEVEIDYFVPVHPWFRSKAFVFIPQRYLPPRGMVKNIFKHLTDDQVIGYTEDEFVNCTLATQKAVEAATNVAMHQYIADITRLGQGL